MTRSTLLLCTAAALLLLAQPGCFFSGGVATISKTTRASGSGFLSVTEHNGQWDTDGPPPKVGDVTERTIYRKLEKATALSIGYVGKVYELTDPYSRRRCRIAAIREVGTASESGGTVHYYEVEFDPEAGG
ncbi:MAG: hypothetical protein HYZ72_19235 [Deltaproteobacteria bacterium]|nr:hypothetical protein [Deltaproteobacteria bacterium]